MAYGIVLGLAAFSLLSCRSTSSSDELANLRWPYERLDVPRADLVEVLEALALGALLCAADVERLPQLGGGRLLLLVDVHVQQRRLGRLLGVDQLDGRRQVLRPLRRWPEEHLARRRARERRLDLLERLVAEERVVDAPLGVLPLLWLVLGCLLQLELRDRLVARRAQLGATAGRLHDELVEAHAEDLCGSK
eukprot:4206560-Prymnesium_polylepis.1